MSLNSSKLTCWSPLISASWKCQGEFVRGSWFNTCTQININNCKQQKQLQITCTISPSSSSVSSTPSLVSTNFISEVDTIPFPSCIYGDFHWFQNWFIPVSIFPSLLPYFDVLLLSFTLSKTLKACLRSSGVSFSCSLWRRYQWLLTCYLERCISRSVFYTSTSITLIIKPTNSPKSTEPEPSASAS